MYCSNCGKQIVDDSNFCSYCGVKVTSLENIDESSPSDVSPSFTDRIYGIDFQIPEGFETTDGVDNKGIGMTVEYNRVYSNGGETIEISVSSAGGGFRWDLSKNRRFDDVDKTINGYKGVFSPSEDCFQYIDRKKLVIIKGASDEQLKSIMPTKKKGFFG